MGEADNKCFWRSEKEKSLWANGIREGFVETIKLGLGWIYGYMKERWYFRYRL